MYITPSGLWVEGNENISVQWQHGIRETEVYHYRENYNEVDLHCCKRDKQYREKQVSN